MPRADRLFALVQLLSGPSRRKLADLSIALETSPRTVYRDLADLEARGVAIDRDHGRYKLSDGAAIKAIPLAPNERLLLALALENPHVERQPAWGDTLRAVRAKLARRNPRTTVATLAGPDRSGSTDAGIVTAIEHAITTNYSISILYTSLNSGRVAWRGIDPWRLLHRSEAWYLVGRCHLHDEPRTFRLDRITGVLPIGTSFERPRDFDAEEWFEHSWGVAKSTKTYDVWIVFDSSVAPLIEHALHHPGERKKRRSDGRLDYHAQVGALDELARWITGFAGAATAVEPSELIERIRNIAESTAAAHRPQRARAAMVKRIRR